MIANSFKFLFLASIYNFGFNIVEGGPVPQNMPRFNGAPGSMPPNMNFGGMGAMNPFGSGKPGFNGAIGMPPNINGGIGGMNPFGSGQPGFNSAGGMFPNMRNRMGSYTGGADVPGNGQPGFNQQAYAGTSNSQYGTGNYHGGPIDGQYGGEDDVVDNSFGLGSLIYTTASVPYLLVSPFVTGFTSLFS
jgi:hypothetical protein